MPGVLLRIYEGITAYDVPGDYLRPGRRRLARDIEYIAFKLRSAINAAGQLERLEKAISGLDTMPERYVLYGAGKWAERGLRKMPVDNYLVYYIPDREV